MLQEAAYIVEKLNHAQKEGWYFFHSVLTHTKHLRNMLGPILIYGQKELTV